MLKLNAEQKLFIIRHLAAGVYPSECSKKFLEEYGIAISRTAVIKYNPNKIAGRSLSQELKDEFYKRRLKFLAAQAKIDISHKNVRLALLDRQLDEALAANDHKSISKYLDLARKEMDPYESRRGQDDDEQE